MPEIRAYAPGIYARSEKLVQATRDLDRGRTTEQAAEEQRLADLRAFIEAQREVGLDYFSDGPLPLSCGEAVLPFISLRRNHFVKELMVESRGVAGELLLA